MITLDQALKAIVAPFVVAALLAALGRWRRWRWMAPAAVGTAFLLGYGLLELPHFPPIDGTDWLFWLAIPATALAILDSILQPKWGWVFGAAAGVVAGVIIYPVIPTAASAAVCGGTAIAVAFVAAGLCLAVRVVEPRVGAWAATAGLCAALGGASVVVLASNSASVGIRGLAGAAALAPLVVLTLKGRQAAGSVSIIATAILAGVLTGGFFYAGVTWTQFLVLMLTPVLLLAGFAVPGKRRWVGGLVALIAVATAVMLVVVPAAVAAKHAAESNDGYGN